MEKEAQQRREEQQFQLRMMQMMSQSVYGVPPPNIHVNPRSFTFRTMHENTLARRMHMFPSQVDSDNELNKYVIFYHGEDNIIMMVMIVIVMLLWL